MECLVEAELEENNGLQKVAQKKTKSMWFLDMVVDEFFFSFENQ